MPRQINRTTLNFVINKTSQPLKKSNRKFSRAHSKLQTLILNEHEKTDRFIRKLVSSASMFTSDMSWIDREQEKLASMNRKKFLEGAFEEKLEGTCAGVLWTAHEAKDSFSEWTGDQHVFAEQLRETHVEFRNTAKQRYLEVSDSLGVLDPELLDQMIDVHREMQQQFAEIIRITAHLSAAASVFDLSFPSRLKASYGTELQDLPEEMAEKIYPKEYSDIIAGKGEYMVASALLQMLYPKDAETQLEKCLMRKRDDLDDVFPSRAYPAGPEPMAKSSAEQNSGKPKISKSEIRGQLAKILSPPLGKGADRGAKMCLKHLERKEWKEILEKPENLPRVVHRHPELQGALDKIKESSGREEQEEEPRERDSGPYKMLEFTNGVKSEIRDGGLNILDVKKTIIRGFALTTPKRAVGNQYFPTAVIEKNIRRALDDGGGRPGGRANETLGFLKSHGVVSTDKNRKTMMINTVESKGQAHPITPIGDKIISAIKKWMVEYDRKRNGHSS
ncbi:MAG: hypothetical protein ACLFUZ_02345 [Candidatus Micrarchaeia archaeon]